MLQFLTIYYQSKGDVVVQYSDLHTRRQMASVTAQSLTALVIGKTTCSKTCALLLQCKSHHLYMYKIVDCTYAYSPTENSQKCILMLEWLCVWFNVQRQGFIASGILTTMLAKGFIHEHSCLQLWTYAVPLNCLAKPLKSSLLSMAQACTRKLPCLRSCLMLFLQLLSKRCCTPDHIIWQASKACHIDTIGLGTGTISQIVQKRHLQHKASHLEPLHSVTTVGELYFGPVTAGMAGKREQA